jgi:hypothetical protein
MFIKLEFSKESEKAYQLPNGSWIPKSILDDRGLKQPYYKIKDWWLSATVEKAVTENDLTTQKTLMGIGELKVTMRDIPQDVLDYWGKYWRGMGSDLGVTNYDRDDQRGQISEWAYGIYD